MSQKPHKASRVSATDLQRLSGVILKKVGNDGEHVIIERGGYSVAVMIPIHEYIALFEPQEESPPAE